ncbi:MAG: transcriptional regulator, MarR family [Candidatus Angelobacter sp.]|jgi:DNA-binding MarR family transcriptional regulator|nr:transcriptional regulator, MarR family [Candidatus Angelobacter sp.]
MVLLLHTPPTFIPRATVTVGVNMSTAHPDTMNHRKKTSRKRVLTLTEYRRLAEFRYQLRRFLRFSEEHARLRGMEPQQHQSLLAVKGLPEGMEPTIANLAERMQLAHHSMVELVDRITEKGLATRTRSSEDRRNTWVKLTPKGEKMLTGISVLTYAELQTRFIELLDSLQQVIG